GARGRGGEGDPQDPLRVTGPRDQPLDHVEDRRLPLVSRRAVDRVTERVLYTPPRPELVHPEAGRDRTEPQETTDQDDESPAEPAVIPILGIDAAVQRRRRITNSNFRRSLI